MSVGPQARVSGHAKDGWDTEWASRRAQEALKWLANNYPECAGSDALTPYEDAAYAAARENDRERYLEALRGYMKAGRAAALEIRRGEASA